jgi:hypothetical protein
MVRDPVSRLHPCWVSGSLRCVLITTKRPTSFAVHVFDGDSPVCMERCKDAVEAAVVAEQLKQIFVKTGRRSHERD